MFFCAAAVLVLMGDLVRPLSLISFYNCTQKALGIDSRVSIKFYSVLICLFSVSTEERIYGSDSMEDFAATLCPS